MRVFVPVLSMAVLSLAALSLGACGEGADSGAKADSSGARPGLTIKTDGAPASPAPPAQKGKLQVLPPGSAGPPVVATAGAPAPAPVIADADPAADVPRPPRDRLASRGDGRYGDWSDGPPQPDDYAPPPPPRDRWAERTDMPPSPRECRRAARRGEPLADTEFCREIVGENEDRVLAENCLAADREGDAFADSRACRRILGY